MKSRKISVLLTLVFVFCLIPFLAFAGERSPKPGDIINSSNIDQFNSYFPEFMQGYIKDGWEIEKPFAINGSHHHADR